MDDIQRDEPRDIVREELRRHRDQQRREEADRPRAVRVWRARRCPNPRHSVPKTDALIH